MSDATTSAPATSPPSRFFARAGKLGMVVIAALGIVYGIIWWQDRPLRDVRWKLDHGQPELALASVNKFLEGRPEDEHAQALKARALADLGKTQDAIALFEKIGVYDATDMVSLGKAYMRVGRWSRAQMLYSQVTSREPANATAWRNLLECQYQTGAIAQGQQSADTLAKLPGQAAAGAAWKAFLYEAQGNRPQALEFYARTLELSPEAADLPIPAPRFFYRYGQVMLAEGHAAEAQQLLERSLAAEPSAEAWAAIGQLQEKAGERAEAEKSFNQALELDPANPETCEALAQRALDAGQYELAQRRLAPLANLPKPRANVARIIAAIYEETGNADEAAKWRSRFQQLEALQAEDEAIERLLRKAPDSVLAKAIRAYQFAAIGNWAQARDLLEPLQEDGSRDQFIRDLWGAILRKGPLPPLGQLPLDQF